MEDPQFCCWTLRDMVEETFGELTSRCRSNSIGHWELTDITFDKVIVSFCFNPSKYTEKAVEYIFKISPDRKSYIYEDFPFQCHLAHNVKLTSDVESRTLTLSLCPEDPGHTIDMTPVHIAEIFQEIFDRQSDIWISYNDELVGEFGSHPPDDFPSKDLADPPPLPPQLPGASKTPRYFLNGLGKITQRVTKYVWYIVEDVEQRFKVRWVQAGSYLEFTIPERFGTGTIGCLRQDGVLTPYIRGGLKHGVKLGWSAEPFDPQWLILNTHTPDISIKMVHLEPSKVYHIYQDILEKLRRIDDLAFTMT